MKTTNITKNKRKRAAWKKPFACMYCDDLTPHYHTLEELCKIFPLNGK